MCMQISLKWRFKRMETFQKKFIKNEYIYQKYILSIIENSIPFYKTAMYMVFATFFQFLNIFPFLSVEMNRPTLLSAQWISFHFCTLFFTSQFSRKLYNNEPLLKQLYTCTVFFKITKKRYNIILFAFSVAFSFPLKIST